MTDVDTSAEAVTRWSVVRNNNGLGYFDGIEPDSNGGFVSYDEYHALAAAYAAARIRQRDTLLRLIAEAPVLEETQ